MSGSVSVDADFKQAVAQFFLRAVKENRPLIQSVGDTVVYPTGPASGRKHPDPQEAAPQPAQQ